MDNQKYYKNIRSSKGSFLVPELGSFTPLEKITLVDLLFREGSQQKDINIPFNKDFVFKYVKNISNFVDIIEMPHVFGGQIIQNLIKDLSDFCKSESLPILVASHVGLTFDEISFAVEECGVQFINAFIPGKVSSTKKTWEAIDKRIDELDKICEYLQSKGVFMRVSLEHSRERFKLDPEKTIETYKRIASKKQVQGIGIADTTGVITPTELLQLLITFNDELPDGKFINLHLHNDGTNTSTKIDTAMWFSETFNRPIRFDVTPFGIGERNGIINHSQILVPAYLNNNIKSFYQKFNSKSFAEYMILMLENSIYIPRVMVDPSWFTHSAGPHIPEFLSDPKSYQIIDPEAFGWSEKNISKFNSLMNREDGNVNWINSGTSGTAVYECLKHFHKIEIDIEKAKDLAAWIRDESIKGSKPTEDEVLMRVKYLKNT